MDGIILVIASANRSFSNQNGVVQHYRNSDKKPVLNYSGNHPAVLWSSARKTAFGFLHASTCHQQVPCSFGGRHPSSGIPVADGISLLHRTSCVPHPARCCAVAFGGFLEAILPVDRRCMNGSLTRASLRAIYRRGRNPVRLCLDGKPSGDERRWLPLGNTIPASCRIQPS